MTKVTVARKIIGFDPDQGIVQSLGDIATEKGRRPAAMISLQQQLAVAGALRERHQFARSLTSERCLSFDGGVEPEAPFGLKRSRVVA